MSLFFEKIAEFIAKYFWLAAPFFLLGDDELGHIRRMVKYQRPLKHGWNWKWPLLEAGQKETAALSSSVLSPQSLETADGINITLRLGMSWRAVDSRKYILGLADSTTVLNDVLCGPVSVLVARNSVRSIGDESFLKELLTQARRRAKRLGCEVEEVWMVDHCIAPTYRIIGVSFQKAEDL